MSENPRTKTARETDDSAMIDDAGEQVGGEVGRSGGSEATDLGTQDELDRAVDDPDGRTRATGEDDRANGNAAPGDS